MKVLIAASFALVASAAFAAPGQFDPAFGQQGVAAVPGTSGELADLVLDGGRIVATGTTFAATPQAAATIVGRWLAGGTLDPTFGTQGVRRLEPISGATRVGLAIRAVPSGYLVLDSLTDPAGTFVRISTSRLLADGQVDATYGGRNGEGAGSAIVVMTFKSGEAFADGSLLLFGQDSIFPLGWFGLTAQGQPDARWILSSASPYLQCPGYPPGRNGYSAPSPGNKVLVAIPVKGSGTAPAFCLTRLNADGTVDATYGTSGHALIQDARFGTDDYAVNRLVVDTDGSAVLAHTNLSFLGNPVRFMYVTAAGSLDVARGDAGLLVPDPNVLHFASAIALQPDGKLLVAGYPAIRIRIAYDSPDISRPRVLRFTRQGAVDPSYGPLGQGYASLADGTRTVRPNAMRVDASGDLVLAGIVKNGPAADMMPAVAKLQGDRPAPPMESSGGGGGGGCGTIRGPGPFDPVLPSLALLSAWVLWRRQKKCTRSSSSSRTSSATS